MERAIRVFCFLYTLFLIKRFPQLFYLIFLFYFVQRGHLLSWGHDIWRTQFVVRIWLVHLLLLPVKISPTLACLVDRAGVPCRGQLLVKPCLLTQGQRALFFLWPLCPLRLLHACLIADIHIIYHFFNGLFIKTFRHVLGLILELVLKQLLPDLYIPVKSGLYDIGLLDILMTITNNPRFFLLLELIQNTLDTCVELFLIFFE